MLNLHSHIKLDLKTIQSPNLCEHFTKDDLTSIGNWVWECFDRDQQSRDKWYKRTEAAMDLALQVQKTKTFPWQNCSNINFPLVTIAALQFHSRAYPAIVNGRKVVDCRIIGDDPQGIQKARADRISNHMSWQLLEQDESWEEEQDRALINVPIVGVNFKKSYYDSSCGHNRSVLVLARDLVLDYWAKSVEDCPTKTHIIPMYRNDIYERVQRGVFEDVLTEAWYMQAAQIYDGPNKDRQNKRDGTNTPTSNENTPFTLLEQHCVLDLDGDGYAEPYIVTIEQSSRQVLRIVTRFDRLEDIERNNAGEVIRINPMEYFTKIPFIPNPDGSIMDIGFGILLGPLNESVNATINQMFDAGTMANTAGGFLGRGAKIRGGIYTFDPFSWNRVDSTGDDLRKNIFPLPVREPSMVMFQLLTFLVEYTNRISGSTDMLVGENPGQNTPAETSRAMVEQGTKIYSAIFKRIWRAMKNEFKKLYVLNSIYLPVNGTTFGAGGTKIAREDYAGGDAAVIPVADPTITSDGARFAQANTVREAARTASGYNPDAVERMFLQSLQVDNLDVIFPGTDKMPPPAPDVKIQVMQMKLEVDSAKLEFEKMKFVNVMQQTQQLNMAKIQELQAKAFKLMEEGKAEPEKNRINAMNASIQAITAENNQINAQIKMMMESMKHEQSGDLAGTGVISGVEKSSSNPAVDALGLPKTE